MNAAYDVGIARMYPINQFELFLLHITQRLNGGSQIPHVLNGFCHFLGRTCRFLFLVDDRRISQFSQHTISPTCRVCPRPIVYIQLGLEQAEPFGIGSLAYIRRKIRRLYILIVRLYLHIVQQERAVGHILGGRARCRQQQNQNGQYTVKAFLHIGYAHKQLQI